MLSFPYPSKAQTGSSTKWEVKPMRPPIGVLLALLLTAATHGRAATREIDKNLLTLPKDLQLQETTPQRYRFTCDYFQVTPTGDFIRKQRVSADYVRPLPDGRVRWNNVTVAEAARLDDPFPAGEKQRYMDGFGYR